MPERALVLLSGGIDSAVALYWARREGYAVDALTFDYARRARREKEATAEVARLAGVPLQHVPLPFLAEVEDLPPGLRRNEALDRAPRGYVPARNLVFYSLASYYAEALGARAIIGGHHSRDAERFPDASPAFFDAFAEAVERGVWSQPVAPIRIVLPLHALTKTEVLRLGARLGVPFGSTWSCYGVDERPCGRCFPCGERADAFAAIGSADPLLASEGEVNARA